MSKCCSKTIRMISLSSLSVLYVDRKRDADIRNNIKLKVYRVFLIYNYDGYRILWFFVEYYIQEYMQINVYLVLINCCSI